MRDILILLDDLRSLAEKWVLLMRDSAHAIPILEGSGANSGVADAVELAEWISSQGIEGKAGFYEKKYSEWEGEVKESEERPTNMHEVSRCSL